MVQMRGAKINPSAGVAMLPVALTLAAAVAGCSGFGGPKKQDAPLPDPNTYPTNYRTQILEFLRQSLTNRADFRGAMIAQPVLKTVGDNQRYVVCVQFNANSASRNKVAIYYAGMISQFIDPSPDQCGDATYQPFKELDAATP